MFLAIIPINDFNISKTRLRRVLKSKDQYLITDLSMGLALNVLSILNKISNLDIMTVTPSIELTKLEKFSVITNLKYNKHDHSVLKGCAGFNAILETIVAEKSHKYDGIFIIMSDLPYLQENSVDIIEEIRKTPVNKIVPSKDGGTSLLYLTKSSLILNNSITFFYGKNSAEKFIQYFNEKTITLETLKDPFIGFDLDTLEDAVIIAKSESKFSIICDKIKLKAKSN